MSNALATLVAKYTPKHRANRAPLPVTRCNNGTCGNDCHTRPLGGTVLWQKQDRIPLVPTRKKNRLSAAAARALSKKG